MTANTAHNPDPLEPLKARFAPDCAPEIAVGPGWVPLLLALDRGLRSVAPAARYQQVKVVFGTLVVHTTAGGDPDLAVVVALAARKAMRTCEHCGGIGHMRVRRRFLRVLCSGCAAEGGWSDARE